MSAEHGTAALELLPVVSDSLPEQADVVIIGGGLIGVAAAWHLAARGLSVTLCEKGVIGGEQSGRNWGWCRNTLRDPAEIPLMIKAMEDWRDPAVFGGLDTGFRTTGIAWSHDARGGAAQAAWLGKVAGAGLSTRLLSRREFAALIPDAALAGEGALYTPDDGCAEPARAAPAIARDAQRLGARIVTHCAVRGVETSGGRLSAIVTEKGVIRTTQAVLAGGIWSRLFAGSLGIRFPQLKVLGSVSITAPRAGGPDLSVSAQGFGWRRRDDDSYVLSRANATVADLGPDHLRLAAPFLPLLRQSLRELRFRLGRSFVTEAMMPRRWSLDRASPFEAHRISDPAPVAPVIDRARTEAAKQMSFFRNLRLAKSWGGYIDVTPDALPAIGELAALPGLVLASGFSGHGFGIGPGAGRLVADLIGGTAPVVDPRPFAPARFGI
ncbi:NAD(P)/FAD-dependent oxidoreductase [Paracoccus aminophilus]|nr:FAD-binding oxidoreductase [Paracoccus aminophilus]